MRRTIAGLTALCIAAGLVSCGSIGENGGKRKADVQAGIAAAESMRAEKKESNGIIFTDVSSQPAVTAAPADNELTSGEDIYEAPVTTAPTAEENGGGETAAESEAPKQQTQLEKPLVVDYYSPEYKPTDAEMYDLVMLAVKQYEAARDKDKQGFIDSLNFGSVVRSDNFGKLLTDVESYEGGEAQDAVYLQTVLIFVEDYAYGKYKEVLTELEGKEDQSRYLSALSSAVDEYSPDNAGKLFDKDGQGIYAQLESKDSGMPEDFETNKAGYTIDDTAFYYAEVSRSEKVGEDLFVTFDLMVLSGDHTYNFYDVCAWSTGSGKGAVVGSVGISDNPYKGKSTRELEGVAKQGISINHANALAKDAFTETSLYLAERQTSNGENANTVFTSGAFAKASSAEGLDLSAGEPEAAGDKALYDSFFKKGIKTGIVFSGPTADTASGYFTQYRTAADSDIIGQYPDPASLDNYTDIVFSKHF